MEHSLGVKKKISPPSPHVNAVLFFHSLSSCSVYPVVICMLCMYGQVDVGVDRYVFFRADAIPIITDQVDR